MTAPAQLELLPSQRERIYRRNFVLFLVDNVMFIVALSIIGSTTVIPDFVRHLTSSEILIGLSGTLWSIGFTLPQIVIARFIIRHERKKWWFVGPNIPVRFVLLTFAGIAVLLGKDRPGLVLIAFFVCYGIAGFGDGLVGVPWSDLIGTSLDNRWRARMLGLTYAITGIIMLLITPLIAYVLGPNGPAFPNNYAILFGASGLLFACTIPIGMFIHELPGGKAVEKLPALSEFLPDLGRLLRDDLPFRSFIIVRMFTNLFLMAAPFYVVYATGSLGLSSDVAVPVLLAMQTVGGVVGALAYTWLGERNNLLAIQVSLAGMALLPVGALLAGAFGPVLLYAGFLVYGLSINSLNSGFQHWIVSYGHADQRPIYVGLSNTLIALISLIVPILGGVIAQYTGYEPLFVVALVMALAALWVTLRSMRTVEERAAAVVED